MTDSRGQRVLHPAREALVATVTQLRERRVQPTHRRHRGRLSQLFEATRAARRHRRRTLRSRGRADLAQPSVNASACGCRYPLTTHACASLFDLYPGSEALEREVYDMFGIEFENHPDLTRILMPEDWIGYPLRKDYAHRAHPCAIQRTHRRGADDHGAGDTSTRRTSTTPRLIGSASHVRARSGRAIDTRSPRIRSDEERMIINMGPSHPSTHGVLRLMLELKARPSCGRSPSSATCTRAWKRPAKTSPSSRVPPT